MLAAFLALKSFSSAIKGKHVKLQIDNTTAVCSIKNMGTSHSITNNTLLVQIWSWCINNNLWLSPVHIPGKQNIAADRESRNTITSTLGFSPNIDLFASTLNYQIKPYVAYTPDPEAYATDAFCLSWKTLQFYAFPPFCLIQRVLQKIKEEQATGLIVVPCWVTQAWWPSLMNMLIQKPLLLPRMTNTLILHAEPQTVHPLFNKLQLLCCHLSGVASLTEEFQKGLQTLSCDHGAMERKSNTELTYKDGTFSVTRGKLIPFVQL